MNQRIREVIKDAAKVLEQVNAHKEDSRANESPEQNGFEASIPHSKE